MPFPAGHYYSPIVDRDEVRERAAKIWPPAVADPPGIDFREPAQRRLLEDVRGLAADYAYPEHGSREEGAFWERNGMFESLDARMYFCLLRHLRPRRVIEVGSGLSSILAADVCRRFLARRSELVFIEPFPPPGLEDGVADVGRVIAAKVQDVPVETFLELDRDDVLFIDSSHVSKTGSDVNFLYLEVLPRLRPGVVVHAHDIFFPHDYPAVWIFDEERSWNEQYLLQALLLAPSRFEVLFGCAYAHTRFPALVSDVFGGDRYGGSFWLKTSEAAAERELP